MQLSAEVTSGDEVWVLIDSGGKLDGGSCSEFRACWVGWGWGVGVEVSATR